MNKVKKKNHQTSITLTMCLTLQANFRIMLPGPILEK